MNDKVTKIRKALSLLENTLGQDLILKEVHKIGGWNPEAAPQLHPLVLLWYKTREEMGIAELTGIQPSSHRIYELLLISDLLQKICQHPEYHSLVTQLQNLDQYEAAIDRMKKIGNDFNQ
ncbi:hypothetical protein Dred_1742 [Desulforamulus reducens MI-1]|uniref:Uncharacterized protein n=1 Tax=Desulforamulus reducens (strain ATCC BAA-1160 / DSM 100696 / MI-1) TaxID=349161 RepID=A4J5B4_DESRM|nr:hypothetical protein [Desulforamulus reducens]ABO50267.1 hypothetical protein Dred_1742 [Desulforamulus reducens MI-1]